MPFILDPLELEKTAVLFLVYLYRVRIYFHIDLMSVAKGYL